MREALAVASRESESAMGMSLTAMRRSFPCIFKNILLRSERRERERERERERDGEQHAPRHQGINNKLLLDHSVLASWELPCYVRSNLFL